MKYTKQVHVLRQVCTGYSIAGKTLSGIARIEQESDISTFYLSLINFAYKPGGNFVAFVVDGKSKLYSFDLGKNPSTITQVFFNNPEISNGFACGICFISENLPILVAFGCPDTFNLKIETFKKLVNDKCLNDLKSNIKEPDEKKEISDISKLYDDEVVATTNYFTDDDIEQKLDLIERLDNESLRYENVKPDIPSKEETEKIFFNASDFQDEKDYGSSQKYSRENPFFLTVKEELDTVFSRFEKEESLCSSVPFSKWVKINYSNDKYYVVGIIYENDVEKYICYGVPSPFSMSPPKELDGFCSFVPLSIFNLKGDGYWIMFQDAITGNCVLMNKD